MARVFMGTQAWGVLWDDNGNVQGGQSVTVKNRSDGTNATHWSALTGGTSSTAAITTSSHGTIDRWIEPGEYTLQVGASNYNVEASVGGHVHEVPLGNTQGFEVTTTSPFGTFSRFRVEGNQDTQPVDVNFWNCTVEFGSIAFSNSQAGAVRFLQPASGDGGYTPTNLLNVYKPGSNTQKVYYVDPNGAQHIVCVGLASKAFEVIADGAANPVFQISETGKIQIGAGGASAPDISIDRTATGVVKLTAATRIEFDGDFTFTKFAANIAFFNKSPAVGKQTVTGAKGSNAALGSLLSALSAYGLITDSTTA